MDSQWKASDHPMHVFNSQSMEDYNKRRVKAKVQWKFAYYAIVCMCPFQ